MEALGLDVKLLIAQVVNLGLLLVVLNKFVYKPLLKVLDDRRKKIEDSLANGRLMEERLASLEAKEKEVITKAEDQVRKEREKILKMAKEEKQVILAEARQAAAREVAKGMARVKQEESESLTRIKNQLIDRMVKDLSAKYTEGNRKILGDLLS